MRVMTEAKIPPHVFASFLRIMHGYMVFQVLSKKILLYLHNCDNFSGIFILSLLCMS